MNKIGKVLLLTLLGVAFAPAVRAGCNSILNDHASSILTMDYRLFLSPRGEIRTDTAVTDTVEQLPSDESAANKSTAPAGFHSTYEDQRRATRSLQPRTDAYDELNLVGLVVDETITPQGRSFYGAFFGVWKSPTVTGFYTVRIEERPSPGRGTLVQVFVNDDIIYRTRVQPQSPLDELALQAARRTYAYVRSGQGILQIR